MSDSDRKEVSATLCIASRTMSVSEITTVMGVAATESYDKGEVLSSRSPKPSMRKEALWLLRSSSPEDSSLETHLDELIAFASSKVKELDQLRAECDIEIFCSFTTFNGQGGFVISHAFAQKIAALKMDCVVNLFALS